MDGTGGMGGQVEDDGAVGLSSEAGAGAGVGMGDGEGACVMPASERMSGNGLLSPAAGSIPCGKLGEPDVAIGLPMLPLLSKLAGRPPDMGGVGIATRPGSLVRAWSALPSEPSGPRIGVRGVVRSKPLVPSRRSRLCVLCGAPWPGKVADVLVISPAPPVVPVLLPPGGARFESIGLVGGGYFGSPAVVALPTVLAFAGPGIVPVLDEVIGV